MQSPQQVGGMQPSPYLMTVPTSPHHSEQANQVLEERTGEQDSPQHQNSGDVNSFGMDMNEMMSLPQDLISSLCITGMPAWPVEEEYLARQHNHYLRKGFRTPSSLGSPPLSAAPTEAPSPRVVEAASADSNQGSVYETGSSDDARPHTAEAIDAAVQAHALSLACMKDVPCIGDATRMHVVEAMEDHLALQNLMEAPCPASPSR